MCDKEKFDKLADVVRQVKHDTGNIITTQAGLGVAVGKVETHLKSLNSRTTKSENRLDNLEDPEFKEVRCVQREQVDRIMRNMLTVDKFEEIERKKQVEKEKQEVKNQQELENRLKKDSITVQKLDTRQRRNSWVTTAIIGLGTLAMAIMGYLS